MGSVRCSKQNSSHCSRCRQRCADPHQLLNDGRWGSTDPAAAERGRRQDRNNGLVSQTIACFVLSCFLRNLQLWGACCWAPAHCCCCCMAAPDVCCRGLNWKHPVFGGCTALGQGSNCRVVKGWDFVGETENGRYRPDGDPVSCSDMAIVLAAAAATAATAGLQR
jgi:hypothetical protein